MYGYRTYTCRKPIPAIAITAETGKIKGCRRAYSTLAYGLSQTPESLAGSSDAYDL